MAQNVEYNGQLIEFPDNMAPGDIEAALKKNALSIPSASGGANTGNATANRVLDTGNALGTGYLRGLVRSTVGLPGDTAANIVDLGKAALGTGYTAVTGKAPPSALELTPRDQTFGTSDTILNGLRRLGLGKLIDPNNPEFEGGFAQTIGGGLSGVGGGGTTSQNVNQAVNATTGAVLGKIAADKTGDPALAIAASMSPVAVRNAAAEATKYAIRGDETGRRAMQQRIQDLQNAGVDSPTLGLASGNKLVGGVENLLDSTPGAIGTMQRSRAGALAGMQDKVNEAATLAAPVRGPAEAGAAIQSGLLGFGEQGRDTQRRLETNLYNRIPADQPTTVGNTQGRLAALNPDTSGAPEFLGTVSTPLINRMGAGLAADTADTGTIPFSALRQARTAIGPKTQASGPQLTGEPTSGQWKSIYGGMSEDLRTAAQQTGPEAAAALQRLNDYTRALKAREQVVQPFADRPAPEDAYNALVRAAPSTVSTTMKTLPPEARATVAGTVAEGLGAARAGAQNDTGTVFSPETYLTNWNKLGPERQRALLSDNAMSPDVRGNLADVAKATAMMRDNSRMWANPSGTGANAAARGLLGGLIGTGAGAGLGVLNPAVPLSIGGGMLAARMVAEGTTSPSIVRAVARQTNIDPVILAGQIRALQGGGLLGNAPE